MSTDGHAPSGYAGPPIPFSLDLRLERRDLMIAAMLGAVFPGPALARQTQGAPAFDLSRYGGKALYLDFWASWCGPCQLSFPYMNRLVAQLPADRFALVAVNVDHDHAKAQAFLGRLGGQVPVVFDPKGDIARQFGVTSMPTSLLIGKSGRTRFTHNGFHPEEAAEYTQEIMELINEG